MNAAPAPAAGLKVYEFQHPEVNGVLTCHVEFMPAENFDGRDCAASVVLHKVFTSASIDQLIDGHLTSCIEAEALASISAEIAAANRS